MSSEQKPKAQQTKRLYLMVRWGTICFAILAFLAWITFYLGVIASASNGALDLADLAELYLAFACTVFALVFATAMVILRRSLPAKPLAPAPAKAQ